MQLDARLTVVSSQMEAEMIVGMLLSHKIQAAERSIGSLGPVYGSPGESHEVLVAASDLAAARKLLGNR
jgi:hypothetical protein